MKLLGIKRVLILAILLAVNLAIAGIFFFGIEPMRRKAETQLTSLDGQISSLRGKIDNVKKELADFKKNLPKYEELNRVGFFNQQDRFQLGRDLDAVQKQSGIAGFGYAVSEVQEIGNADAAKSSSRLIRSEISITNPLVLNDGDFYGFIHAMMTHFPSHIRLASFQVSRKGDVDDETLRKVRTQEERALVNATAIFQWMTIVPEEKKADAQKSGWGR